MRIHSKFILSLLLGLVAPSTLLFVIFYCLLHWIDAEAAERISTSFAILLFLWIIASSVMSFLLPKYILAPFHNLLTKGANSWNQDEDDEILRPFIDLLRSKSDLTNRLDHLADKLEQTEDITKRFASFTKGLSIKSAQLSDASQTLSQGATEQAASVEQINASLTEIETQSKNNAKNAWSGNEIAKKAIEATQKGNAMMVQMTKAMNDIVESSHEIGKTMTMIDEIAFQTQILALNAAVEAARAGQHGKGFAVVSSEVKNLATRSGKAANQTSVMVEKTIANIENGMAITKQSVETLSEIESVIIQCADIMNKITADSHDQAQKVEQVNSGLSQIDIATQQNAATAERTASYASDLNDQTTEVEALLEQHGIVGDVNHEELMSNVLIRWTDKFLTGVDEVDEQHKRLVEMINDLFEAMSSGKAASVMTEILSRLADYTVTHFGYEEEMMRKNNYQGYQRHKKIHEDLVARVVEFKTAVESGTAAIGMDLMNFLKNWLTEHILKVDQQGYGHNRKMLR